MAATLSPDTDTLINTAPRLRAQLVQLQTILSLQMNKPTFQLKLLGAALRHKATQKKRVTTIQRHFHKQFSNSLTDTLAEQAILLSQSTSHTGAHLMQPRSEAYEAEDRCFRVLVARRLILPHPAAFNAQTKVRRVSSATNQWMRNSIIATAVGAEEVLTAGLHLWGDALQTSFTHTVAPRCSSNRKYLPSPVFSTDRLNMLGWVLSLTSTARSRMWMCLLLLLFSCNPSLVSAANTKPGLMVKRAGKNKFDRYPHINLVPVILETTDRPGPHARKLIGFLMRDADNPPLAIRDTWSAIQSVFHSAIPKQQLTAAVT